MVDKEMEHAAEKSEENIQNKEISCKAEFINEAIKTEVNECIIPFHIKEEEKESFLDSEELAAEKSEENIQNKEICCKAEFINKAIKTEVDECIIPFHIKEEEKESFLDSEEFVAKNNEENNETEDKSFNEEYINFINVEGEECKMPFNIKKEAESSLDLKADHGRPIESLNKNSNEERYVTENMHNCNFEDEETIKTPLSINISSSLSTKKILKSSTHCKHYNGDEHFQCLYCSNTTLNDNGSSCSYSASEKNKKLGQARTHTGEKPYKCLNCSYSSSIKSHLVRHTRTHTGEKPFKCSSCSYRATRKTYLVEHMRTHTGEKRFKCSSCSYSALQKIHLVNHIKTHTGERPFKCPSCPYSATENRNLVIHVRTHTGEKPFKCSICSYCAAEKSLLVKHVRTHTEEKPFKCSCCSYSTFRKTHLVEHMRTHTGEKPFKCSSCSYSASRKTQLVEHMRTHTGEKPYKCQSCSYSSSRKNDLHRHMRTHTEEKPFKCSSCSYSAGEKSALLKHMRHHT